MKLKSITGSLLAAAGLLLANPANADLTFLGDYSSAGGGNVNYDADAERAELTCTNCEGMISNLGDLNDIPPVQPGASDADGFDNAFADLFVNTFGGNPADETDFLNAALAAAGIADTVSGGVQTQMGGGDAEFCTSSEYVLFKIGALPNYAIVQNTSGGSLCYDYVQTGQGAGLSHIVTFGGGTSVSEPNILALFGAGLVLLGFLRRRTIV